LFQLDFNVQSCYFLHTIRAIRFLSPNLSLTSHSDEIDLIRIAYVHVSPPSVEAMSHPTVCHEDKSGSIMNMIMCLAMVSRMCLGVSVLPYIIVIFHFLFPLDRSLVTSQPKPSSMFTVPPFPFLISSSYYVKDC
jgi:hypothetical protein